MWKTDPMESADPMGEPVGIPVKLNAESGRKPNGILG
jgi:hypothetical protein